MSLSITVPNTIPDKGIPHLGNLPRLSDKEGRIMKQGHEDTLMLPAFNKMSIQSRNVKQSILFTSLTNRHSKKREMFLDEVLHGERESPVMGGSSYRNLCQEISKNVTGIFIYYFWTVILTLHFFMFFSKPFLTDRKPIFKYSFPLISEKKLIFQNMSNIYTLILIPVYFFNLRT